VYFEFRGAVLFEVKAGTTARQACGYENRPRDLRALP
jgi:hypothetical protein